MELDLLLDKAKQLALSGSYEQAKERYLEILESYPLDKRALNNLGIMYSACGQPDLSLKTYLRVLEIDPCYSDALSNLAKLYSSMGDSDQALYYLNLSLCSNPYHEPTVLNAVAIYESKGQVEKAVEILLAYLESENTSVAVLIAYSRNLLLLGRVEHAATALERVIRLDSSIPYVHSNLGAIYRQLGHLDRSLYHLRKAVTLLHSDDHNTYYNIALVYSDQARLLIASAWAKRAIAVNPRSADAFFLLGNIYCKRSLFLQAIDSYLEAITLNPTFQSAYCNIATAYIELFDFDSASKYITTALALDPQSPESNYTQGRLAFLAGHPDESLRALSKCYSLHFDKEKVLILMGALHYSNLRIKEAIRCAHSALSLNQQSWESKAILSRCHLVLENYKDGWSYFSSRWYITDNINHLKLKKPQFADLPVWKPGTPGAVLVWGEQGIGDVVMFSSILPDLLSNADNIVMTCDARLIPLLRRSFPAISELRPEYDTSFEVLSPKSHISIADLAPIYRTNSISFPTFATPYLRSDQVATSSIRCHLEALPAYKRGTKLIGLCWYSRIRRPAYESKSIPLHLILENLNIPNSVFVNLQYDISDSEVQRTAALCKSTVYTYPSIDLLNDIDNCASLIAACDHVVSISSTVAHLSGALGISTHVLLPYSPDWRWGLASSTSCWYSSVTLYRQCIPMDWQIPLQQVYKALL